MSRKLNYNRDGWAELDNSVQVHKNGQGRVVLRACGAILTPNAVEPATAVLDANPDYAEFSFRMLSKVLVECYALDFTRGNVLKDALPLFATKLFRDHNTNVKNAIGVSLNPRWTNTAGVEGVDATFRIFRSLGADMIAALTTDPPVLDSDSCALLYTWVKSHPGMDGFYWRLGEEVEDDKGNRSIVRIIITDILAVPEASIVWQGADPNAKRLSYPGASNHSFNEEDTMNIKALLLNKLGVAEHGTSGTVELSEDQLASVLEKAGGRLIEAEKRAGALEAGIAGLLGKKSLEDIADGLSELGKMLEEPKRMLEETRQNALKFYRQSTGEPDKTIEGVIEGSNLEQAKAFAKQFGAELEKQHPLKCEKCGGGLSRASAENPGPKKSRKKDVSKYQVKGGSK